MGMHGWKHVNRAIQSADLLIAIGMRFDDRVIAVVQFLRDHIRVWSCRFVLLLHLQAKLQCFAELGLIEIGRSIRFKKFTIFRLVGERSFMNSIHPPFCGPWKYVP